MPKQKGQSGLYGQRALLHTASALLMQCGVCVSSLSDVGSCEFVSCCCSVRAAASIAQANRITVHGTVAKMELRHGGQMELQHKGQDGTTTQWSKRVLHFTEPTAKAHAYTVKCLSMHVPLLAQNIYKYNDALVNVLHRHTLFS